MSETRILRRLPGSRYSEVVAAWPGATAVILGGGPSLTLEQVRVVERSHSRGEVRVIAVNDSYLWAPFADAHYAADAKWHRWHTDGVPKPVLGLTAEEVARRWAEYGGERATIENSGGFVNDARLHVLRNKHFPQHGYGVSLDPRALITGRNSGFQALNLAVLAGAKRIVLLGFDARENQPMSHWHGEHPGGEMPLLVYEEFRRSFTAAARDLEALGVLVLNCSPGTAITAFRRCSLSDALLREAA